MLRLFKGFVEFLLLLFRKRSLIAELAKRDIRTQHVGSALGFFWTFVHPVIMLCILWFVFSYVFAVPTSNNVPFVVWLAAGMTVWNTFVEVVSGSTSAIVQNTHLVKKIVFPLSILPVVKLVSSFITHAVSLIVLFLLIIFYSLPITVYWLQFFYYFAAMALLALGIGWLTSSVMVFVRDTGQVVTIVLQLGFWATPIFWDPANLPSTAQTLIKLNPMFYIVQGYRDSFIYSVPLWHHPLLTLYFWSVVGVVFFCGALVFLRLRPHFADVL